MNNKKQVWHIGVIRKTNKTAIMQIRKDKDCLSPDITYYIGEWFGDPTPTYQDFRNVWRNDINSICDTKFTRLIVDSDTIADEEINQGTSIFDHPVWAWVESTLTPEQD